MSYSLQGAANLGHSDFQDHVYSHDSTLLKQKNILDDYWAVLKCNITALLNVVSN